MRRCLSNEENIMALRYCPLLPSSTSSANAEWQFFDAKLCPNFEVAITSAIVGFQPMRHLKWLQMAVLWCKVTILVTWGFGVGWWPDHFKDVIVRSSTTAMMPFHQTVEAFSSWLNLNRLKISFGTYQVSHQNHGLNGSTSTTPKLLGKGIYGIFIS